ncbi:hypothetical protein NDU88_009938 [Pleurodeles waltl]|uniref:Uncharacterized protein n=1 Tax=Pleurodeles waltl TaxID=8319 RepID=A0AAV7QVY3_PLEWA|nr:hypothetical protein NDU88_009938 [Pleurodeles waltl]
MGSAAPACRVRFRLWPVSRESSLAPATSQSPPFLPGRGASKGSTISSAAAAHDHRQGEAAPPAPNTQSQQGSETPLPDHSRESGVTPAAAGDSWGLRDVKVEAKKTLGTEICSDYVWAASGARTKCPLGPPS